MKLYLLVIWDDIEPEVMGPYATTDDRLKRARDFREEEGDKHGVFRLDIEGEGVPDVFSFSNAEIEEE